MPERPLKERIAQANAERQKRYPGSEEFWNALRADLDEGRHPTTKATGKALDSGRPVPKWATKYITGRLEGTIRLPPGAPRWSMVGLTIREADEFANQTTPGTRTARSFLRHLLAEEVARMMRRYEDPRHLRARQRLHEKRYGRGRRPPEDTAYRWARRQVSERYGIPEDTLDKYCYPRRR